MTPLRDDSAPGRQSVALGLALSLGITACAPSATLTTWGDTTYSGRPIANDETHVMIDDDGTRYVLCKRDVKDAAHAGGTMAIVGGSMLGAGLVVAVATARTTTIHDETQRDPLRGVRVVAGAVAVAGLVLLLVGGTKFGNGQAATGLPASPETLAKPCEGGPREAR